MEQKEILLDLNSIFRNLFKDQTINLSLETKASDIDDWDSLNHAMMIAAVEKHFQIKFELMEMLQFKNVGSMVEVIEKKLSVK
jgi:acyl carrier protein